MKCSKVIGSCKMSTWGQRRAIVVNITKIIIMKPRRLTRRMLLKTSLTSAFMIVVLFSLIYFTVLVLNSNRKRAGAWMSSHGLETFQKRYGFDEKQIRHILEEMGTGNKLPPVSDGSAVIWDSQSLNIHGQSSLTCNNNLVLVILVISSPQNSAQRSSIRKTWCSAASDNQFQCIFLLGNTDNDAIQQELVTESEQHKDILFGNYKDTYRNLTLKVLHGLFWVDQRCSDYQYLLKTDDDCFVNSNLITKFLSTYNTRTRNLYAGNIYTTGKKNSVIRDPNSKWYVSYEEYTNDKYPPYASGEGYIISHDLIRQILELSRTHLKPFPNEDAYIGVAMKYLGIDPLHSHRFTLANVRWSVCNFMYLMVLHNISPERQSELYNTSLQAVDQCKTMRKITAW